MITHLVQENGNKIHISHLLKYVSAYDICRENWESLGSDIMVAHAKAKSSGQTQIVSHDGECCFHVTPAGYVILMLPWREYTIDNPNE